MAAGINSRTVSVPPAIARELRDALDKLIGCCVSVPEFLPRPAKGTPHDVTSLGRTFPYPRLASWRNKSDYANVGPTTRSSARHTSGAQADPSGGRHSCILAADSLHRDL